MYCAWRSADIGMRHGNKFIISVLLPFLFLLFFLEWQHINTIKCRWVRNQLTFLFLQQRFVCQLCLMRSCHWLILFFTILNNNTQFSGVRRSPVWPSSWPRSRRASTGSSARTAPTVSVRANGLKDCPHNLGKDNCIELSMHSWEILGQGKRTVWVRIMWSWGKVFTRSWRGKMVIRMAIILG